MDEMTFGKTFQGADSVKSETKIDVDKTVFEDTGAATSSGAAVEAGVPDFSNQEDISGELAFLEGKSVVEGQSAKVERRSLAERAKDVLNTITSKKDQVVASCKEKFGERLTDKANKFFIKEDFQKLLKVGGQAVAGGGMMAGAAFLSGTPGLFAAPMLYMLGSKMAANAAIEGAQYMGGERRLMKKMQQLTAVETIEKQYGGRLVKESLGEEKYREHIGNLVQMIHDQEQAERPQAAEQLAAMQTRNKKFRAYASAAFSVGMGVLGGVPLGIQDFNGDGLSHSVKLGMKGFEYLDPTGAMKGFSLVGSNLGQAMVGTGSALLGVAGMTALQLRNAKVDPQQIEATETSQRMEGASTSIGSAVRSVYDAIKNKFVGTKNSESAPVATRINQGAVSRTMDRAAEAAPEVSAEMMQNVVNKLQQDLKDLGDEEPKNAAMKEVWSSEQERILRVIVEAKKELKTAQDRERIRAMGVETAPAAAPEVVTTAPPEVNTAESGASAIEDALVETEAEAEAEQQSGEAVPEKDINEMSDDEIREMLTGYDGAVSPEVVQTYIGGEGKESTENYVRSMKDLVKEHGSAKVREVAGAMVQVCGKVLSAAGLEVSGTAKSQSWAMWDMAKQFHLLKQEGAVDGKYRLADPITDTKKQAEMARRQIGWEVYAVLGPHGNEEQKTSFFEKAGKVNPDLAGLIKTKLEMKPKDDGQLSSQDYAALGALVARFTKAQEVPVEAVAENIGVSESSIAETRKESEVLAEAPVSVAPGAGVPREKVVIPEEMVEGLVNTEKTG